MREGMAKAWAAVIGMTIAGGIVCFNVDRENDRNTALRVTFTNLNINPDQHKALKHVILGNAPCEDAICEQAIREYKEQFRIQRALTF